MFETDRYVGWTLEGLHRSWIPEAVRTDESCGLEYRKEVEDQTGPLVTESEMPPVHTDVPATAQHLGETGIGSSAHGRGGPRGVTQQGDGCSMFPLTSGHSLSSRMMLHAEEARGQIPALSLSSQTLGQHPASLVLHSLLTWKLFG